MRGRILVFALIVSSFDVAAQTSKPTFEVASVKPSPDPRVVGGIVTPNGGSLQPGGRWIASFVSLEAIIRSVYPGHSFPGQIVGGPSWVRTDRWEIVAKTDPGRSNDEIREMARALLADRFQLSLHVEKRELPVYRLVRERDDGTLGPGLRIPEIDCDAYRAGQRKGEPLPPPPIADRLPCVAVVMNSRLSRTGSRLTAGGTPISGITTLIASVVGRPVVDSTGLKQPFDIELEFSARPLAVSPSSADDGPSIFEAIRNQLGLRLESARGPVEVLVIDSVQPPTGN